MKYSPKNYEVRIWYSSVPGDDCYVAQVVDLPGTMADGKTVEEAAKNIQSALAATLSTYADDGIEPPAPRSAAAVAMGKVGGAARTIAKRAAARANGRKGGRPRKSIVAK